MLPLLQKARGDGFPFVLTARSASALEEGSFCGLLPDANPTRIPRETLQPGEQYRFHFDMSQCIGCKCCVVACNEQNGNPAAINWRRVGEIEGGFYPNTNRFYLSMGCNHCLEPSCLIGCPVDAYKKDAVTGIVRHSADACIGCQYCTWNCSYGVPQYNPERGVVGKCDMCYDRLIDGREPACVNACPEGAILIEIVKIDEWRKEYASSANAPGLPSADDSISTTRVTLPQSLPHDLKKANFWRLKTEDPHWPLVIMTVLTQLSAGAFAAIWVVQLLTSAPTAAAAGPASLGGFGRLGVAALGSLLVGALALGASTMHLGRPIHAYRALRMWKRSWLSREVLMFGCFSAMSSLYAGSLLLRLPGSLAWGALTTLFGIAGVTASTCIYLVPARPAWNNKNTIAEFFLTAALLGPLFAASINVSGRWLLVAPAVAAAAALLNLAVKFLRMTASDVFELKGSAWLLSTGLSSRLLLRGALLIAGGILLPLSSSGRLAVCVAFGVALAGEIVGRYLFFASVVPKNMADSYLPAGKAAA